MNTRRFVWGLVIVVLGGLLLATNFGLLGEAFWNNIWKYWPALLVIWGILILADRKEKKSGLGLIISAIILLAIVVGVAWYNKDVTNTPFSSTNILEKAASDQNVDLTVKFGASNLTLNDTGVANEALSGVVRSQSGAQVTRSEAGDSLSLILDQVAHGEKLWFNTHDQNTLNLALSNELPYRLKLETGASKFDLSLANAIINSLDVSSGASSGKITLGNKATSSNVNVSSGASSFTIRVPKAAPLRIMNESGMSSLDLDGFSLYKNGKEYKSEGYDTGSNKIDIRLSTGASSIKIEQY